MLDFTGGIFVEHRHCKGKLIRLKIYVQYTNRIIYSDTFQACEVNFSQL